MPELKTILGRLPSSLAGRAERNRVTTHARGEFLPVCPPRGPDFVRGDLDDVAEELLAAVDPVPVLLELHGQQERAADPYTFRWLRLIRLGGLRWLTEPRP